MYSKENAVIFGKLLMALGRQDVINVSDEDAIAYVKYNKTEIQVMNENEEIVTIVSDKEIKSVMKMFESAPPTQVETETIDNSIQVGDEVTVTLEGEEPKDGEVKEIKYIVKGFGTKHLQAKDVNKR